MMLAITNAQVTKLTKTIKNFIAKLINASCIVNIGISGKSVSVFPTLWSIVLARTKKNLYTAPNLFIVYIFFFNFFWNAEKFVAVGTGLAQDAVWRRIRRKKNCP